MGLLQTLGQDCISGPQTTQQGLSFQLSSTEDRGRLLPVLQSLGAWEGLPRGSGILSVTLKPAVHCAPFSSFSISLAVFKLGCSVRIFFPLSGKYNKAGRPTATHRCTLPSRQGLLRKGKVSNASA